MSAPLPKLEDLTSPQELTDLLSTLFEPSPPLRDLLVPSVELRLSAAGATGQKPATYSEIIDLCANVAEGWTWEQKAEFLSGHPMIGETGKVSALSGKEQRQTEAVPQEVLQRLAQLNALYNTLFPGLRYITFVNGRSRAEIVTEMEGRFGNVDSADEGAVKEAIRQPDSPEWKAECERGLGDVWLIGKARLKGLGVE